MSDGVFRSKKGFTVVQNSVTRNKELSLKAKGLYMLIQSYITMPEKSWLKSDFQEMVSLFFSPDGKVISENLRCSQENADIRYK